MSMPESHHVAACQHVLRCSISSHVHTHCMLADLVQLRNVHTWGMWQIYAKSCVAWYESDMFNDGLDM